MFARDCRYSDLRDALPGIATNLLADRLRHLHEHGVIERYDAPAPVRAGDAFRTHWMELGLPVLFHGVRCRPPDAIKRLRTLSSRSQLVTPR